MSKELATPIKASGDGETANLSDANGEFLAICWRDEADAIAAAINSAADYRKAAEVEALAGDEARQEASELRKALVEIAELTKTRQLPLTRLINDKAIATLKANT